MDVAISVPRYQFCDVIEEDNVHIKKDYSDFLNIEQKTIRNQPRQYGENNTYNEIERPYIGNDLIGISTSSALSISTGLRSNGFNLQTQKYVSAIQNVQDELNQQTEQFLQNQEDAGVKMTATNLRNKGNWTNVKRLVVRDELMKLQIGNKTDLPLTNEDINKLKDAIKNKDLSDFSDKELQKLIDGVLKPDPEKFLQALKDYKKDGTVSPYFQEAKLQSLLEELQNVDLDKITAKEFKHLMDNYWEKLEIHHRTSISSDATKQSDIDNLDTLNTTQHDEKHTVETETGEKKIDYREPCEEESLDRKKELEDLNKKRVIRNELKGLGVALLIAGGTGFAIGFVVQLAQNGLNPNSFKNALVAGTKSSGDAMVVSGGSYVLSRTVGMSLATSINDTILEKLGEKITAHTFQNLSSAISFGVAGSLSLMVSLTYQFVKLKINGYSTKESMLRIKKTAQLQFSCLCLSVFAQGIWGGCAGVVVSISAGVIITGANIVSTVHDKEIKKKISIYFIEMHEPTAFSCLEIA